jgi:hypothetical protein
VARTRCDQLSNRVRSRYERRENSNGYYAFAPAISTTGRCVALQTAAPLSPEDVGGNEDIHVRDLVTGRTQQMSVATDGTQANGSSCDAALAEYGQTAFSPQASNLAPGDTNSFDDIFIRS